MNKRIFMAAASVLFVAPLSIVAYAINSDNLVPAQTTAASLNYADFDVMNSQEMEETRGKVGPAVIIAGQGVAGAAAAIGNAYASAPNNSPGTSEVISQGVGGFVAGGLNPVVGPVAAGALGLSAYGATQAMLGGGGGGDSGCQTCHGMSKQ
ncbi:hypothetical protein [Winslowiella iniecta]|uniref:Uncharacterized protein n=1 Tax=Winslowiella iniecta TaxID=1560201 RepID=A0A0L7T842_9GAMM|nr:hypothetical protein [Winslowiella iniecta]KOC91539.1 hypothetical protein NG42_04655 [Winslowiella iniecta]KOC94509.1 hypothetical protein NG43_04845 [Winslowiella iniecta]